jgi:hypothetical protein
VTGVAGQSGVEHRLDRRVLGEEFGHGRGILTVPLHPHHQRLESAQREVGVERAWDGAGSVLQEREGGVEFFVVGEQCAADHVGVSADVLGGGVQHDVGAVHQRLLQRR